MVVLGMLLDRAAQKELHELIDYCALHGIDLIIAVALPVLDTLCEQFEQSPQSAAQMLQSLRGQAGLPGL